jgi:hypothetical protein
MNSINESLDDLPLTSIIKKVNRLGNENCLFDKQQPSTMIDSAIFSVEDIEHFEKEIDRTIPLQHISTIRKMAIERTGQDRDNPQQ